MAISIHLLTEPDGSTHYMIPVVLSRAQCLIGRVKMLAVWPRHGS